MTTVRKRSKMEKLTLLGMLTAIQIVLGYINIPMPGGLSITFIMIPVAVAAIAMGISGGLTMGTVFGLISFLQCFSVFGHSALGATLVNYNAFLTFVQRVLSRALVGLMAALVFAGLKKTKLPLYFKGAITGFSAAFFNTLFFMGALVLFFSWTPEMQNSIAGRGFFTYLVASVGINAVVEMAVAALVTGGVAVALKKTRQI